MLSKIASFLLSIFGWKVTGAYPDEYKKLILIAAPHTSWTDFFIGITVRVAINKKIKFIGKNTLFKWPLRPVLRWMGGIPVDRSKSTNFVQAVVDLYNNRDELSVIIAPEGTRKKVEKFKTGFYYIAKLARIPILMVKFNYEIKEVHLGPVFIPTDDAEGDIKAIEKEFKGIKGKIPELSFKSSDNQ